MLEPFRKPPSPGRLKERAISVMDWVRATLKAGAWAPLFLFASGVFLFGEPLAGGPGPGWLQIVAREIRAACRDPGTQWMVFACAGIYFVTFTALANSRKEKPESRKRKSECGTQTASLDTSLLAREIEDGAPHLIRPPATFSPEQRRTTFPDPSGEGGHPEARYAERGRTCDFQLSTFTLSSPDLWLCGLLLIAALHYAFNYATASGSTQALMLIVGAAIGKGARLWAEWGKAESGKGAATTKHTEHTKGGTENFQRSTFNLQLLLTTLLLLLAVASLWHPEGATQFQYRGLNRWSGPWDNPNIFGLLMGVGVVIAAGLLVAGFGLPNSGSFPGRGKGWVRWLWRLILFAGLSCCAVGLLKSYSRGAWLGTALGLAVLAFQSLRFRVSGCQAQPLIPTLSPSDGERVAEGRERGTFSCNSCVSWLSRNWLPFSILFASLLVLSFWQFRHTEFHPVRRAFSVGNPNDFSWRNRVAAWEGALAMMADKPIAGFGWNKPERIYDQFYRPPKVSEGMAIQLNHYFILGMSLGLPALICFAAYIGLSLTRRGERGVRSEDQPRYTRTTRKGEPQNSDESRLQPSTWNQQLHDVCHASVVVLLIGLWFDGGLFNLATASVFWVLLEAGRVTPCAPFLRDTNGGQKP